MPNDELFSEVNKHFRDDGWLDKNADELYWVVKERIKDKKSLDSLVNSLLLYYPYLLERGDLRRWAKIADRAVRKIRKRQSFDSLANDSVFQVYTLNPVAVKRAPSQREHSKRVNQREMLEIYFELMIAQIIDRNIEDLDLVIDSAVKFVRTVNDQYYYGKFYQILAFIRVSRKDIGRALDVATLSYDYYKDTYEDLEIALTTYIIAACNKQLRNYDEALMWLSVSGSHFEKVDGFQRQHTMMALEASGLYLHLKDYEAALHWAEIGLNMATKAKHQPQIAQCNVYMSRSLMWLRRFDEALDHAQIALELWEASDDVYQVAHADYWVAFLEACQGRDGDALVRLSRLLQKAKSITESEQRNDVIQKAKQLISSVERGEDPFSLI